jgi:hypothetical protein
MRTSTRASSFDFVTSRAGIEIQYSKESSGRPRIGKNDGQSPEG